EGVTLADTRIINLIPRKFTHRPKPTLENAYKISSVPGKGLGMFAARDIPAGAVILVENPVIVIPRIVGVGMSLSKDQIFEMLFERLELDVRHRALSLWNS